MKVAIQCESPLLQRSLELFLEGHLGSLRHCDIVVRDHIVPHDKRLSLLIGTSGDVDLLKPFSKGELFRRLQEKINLTKDEILINECSVSHDEIEEKVSSDILERHIEKLTQEYQANILKAIKAFYEK
ncbi:MAG: hypothetical protein NTY39_08605 [Campylobacterales bacterium]|jgi:hypothetical protein|nr:hypothetical protein [Campylobacterales bacterium]